uniref:ribonuclease H n=1 Tax=viral metagenome TaxID=1070528 RepID=A0A6C0E0X5_9ZZZZ
MYSHKDVKVLLYKKKLNATSLIDIIDSLSVITLSELVKDLKLKEGSGELKNVEYTDSLYVFTDGNCKNNGKKNARAAYGIYFPEERYKEFNKTGLVTEGPTNQKAELTAMKEALKAVHNILGEHISKKDNISVTIVSDSIYSINCVTKWSANWLKNDFKTSKGEKVKNESIIRSILKYMEAIKTLGVEVSYRHIHSHTNEPADKDSFRHFLWHGNYMVDSQINKALD